MAKTDAMGNGEGGRWLSIEEAAKLLGITADGVRKRVRRGQLEARRGNDGPIRVLVPSETVSDQPETVSDSIGLVLDSLRRDRDAARVEADRWRQAAEERSQALTRELIEARERAGRAEGEAMALRDALADLSHRLDMATAELVELRRPWWRRWLR
jgi:excisionase family DNA binding protein